MAELRIQIYKIFSTGSLIANIYLASQVFSRLLFKSVVGNVVLEHEVEFNVSTTSYMAANSLDLRAFGTYTAIFLSYYIS